MLLLLFICIHFSIFFLFLPTLCSCLWKPKVNFSSLVPAIHIQKVKECYCWAVGLKKSFLYTINLICRRPWNPCPKWWANYDFSSFTCASEIHAFWFDHKEVSLALKNKFIRLISVPTFWHQDGDFIISLQLSLGLRLWRQKGSLLLMRNASCSCLAPSALYVALT